MYKLLLCFLLFACLQFGCKPNSSVRTDLSELKRADSLKVAKQLMGVYEDDQKYRRLSMEAIEKYGVSSPQIQALSKKIHVADSANLAIVKSVIDKYGWLSASEIGDQPSATLFLVAQHAPLKERLHFLRYIQLAAKNGAIKKEYMAFFEDRVALDQGKKQIYGTQMGYDTVLKKYYLFPLENPKQVDERRAEFGLSPIAVQMAQWNIKSSLKK